jgi:DNA uptake protein ComE-like DNA-binding protein
VYNLKIDGEAFVFIFLGDRILSVGEIPLKNVTHKQAVEIIQNAPDICMFIVERGAGSVSPQSSVRSSNSSTGSVDSRQLTGPVSVDIRTPSMMQMFSQGEKQQNNLDADITEESETESKSKSSSSKADSTTHVEENRNSDWTESECTAEDMIAEEVKTQGVSGSKDINDADCEQLEEKPGTEEALAEDLIPGSLESTRELEARTELGDLQREASELTDTSEGSIPSSDGNIYYPFVNKGTYTI